MPYPLSASLVLFNTDPVLFEPAINSFLSYKNVLLYVVDNSPMPLNSELFSNKRVKYIHVGKNIGFGAGHNLALKLIGYKSEVHLFLNPDVFFSPDVISGLLDFFQADPTVGAAMPRVLYFSGEDQKLCKLLPTPLDLILRRFIPLKWFQSWVNKRYELWDLDMSKVIEIPNLSGCFLFCRTSILQMLGGFDERYFMYLEDVDLVRRIADSSKTLFIPTYKVIHKYEKGSYSNRILLLYHIISAIKYFNKWGWFFDSKRRIRNKKILENLKYFE